MNNWIKRVVTFAIVAAQFLVIPAVSADSLENIQNKKEEVQAEVTRLQKDVESKLAEASELSIALNNLNNEIAEHEASISQTEVDIEKQEMIVKERYDYTADQLKAMQKNEVNRNLVLNLLQAESVTDLFNTVYVAVKLTGASEDHLNEAQEEQEKLNNLKEELLVYQDELNEKQEETVVQQEALETKLVELKETLSENQSVLANLSAEENAILAEQERKAAQQRATVAASSSNKSSASVASANTTSSAPASTASETQAAQSDTSQAGSWMTFQSTGYSTQQAGLSTHTALGINLLNNPRVIAVDPSQIPLGSLVEVQGMGVYIAGDTGGAIKGRIIDIHFSTVSQALSWGRRSVNIRIIN